METMTAMLDSLRPADSARSAETTQHRRPTSKDILAGGYNCQREIPEPVECEFCGRKLYHEALVMGRTVLMFAPFPKQPGESITTIVNFEEGRTYCKDIDRPAWGYIEYTAPLDQQQVSDYELVQAPQEADHE